MIKILKVFYRFESGKRIWFTLFIISVILAAFLGSIYPYFYKLLVDSIPAMDYQRLLFVLLAFIGIRVANMIVSSVSYVLGDVVSFQGGIDARKEVLERIQDLDFAFHTSKSTGSLISAMKRGDNAYYSLHHAIHYRILDIAVGLGVMIYFFGGLDFRIGLLVVVSFLINLILTKFIVAYNVRTRDKFNEEEDKISGIIVDNIINYETVKLFAKESWERSRLDKAFIPWEKTLWGYANSFRLLDIGIGSLVNISIFLILLISLSLVEQIRMGLGDFVLVLGFVNAFFPRFFDLVYGFRDIAKNYADIKKYFGILDYDIRVKDPKDPVEIANVNGEIEFKNVSFNYETKKTQVIKNVNLKVRRGQSIALVGRSGAGKTTLVKLLMRFYDVDDGAITIDNINLKDFTKSHLRSLMGVVPQEPILFNNTIGYNIAYGKEGATKKEVVAASKIARIADFVDSLPLKYNTKVGERGIKLSGGQKQRVAIARMILSDPDIIIFDEATSQLDSESERLIQEGFWKAAEGKTTIVIAHRLSTVMRCDKIVVMEKGRIVETGTHRELFAQKDSLYRHFWDLQINSK